MAVAKFGDLYTSGKAGEEVLSCYNLESLVLSGVLCRVNKVSENGVSLTIAIRLTEDYESKVSKGAKEKGVNPVKTSSGEILVFQVNSSVKDDRKPEERNGRCQTLIDAFTGKMKKGDDTITLHENPVQDGSVIRLTLDGEQIPMKGLINPKSFKAYLGEKEDSIIFIEPIEEDLTEEDQEVLNLLKSSKAPTGGNYQNKKSFADNMSERLKYLETIMKDPKGDVILRVAAYLDSDIGWQEFENGDSHWVAQDENMHTFILNILRP
jgi:hypothetical protein